MSSEDRNFDDLTERFSTRIYATAKGEWRLKILKQDLSAVTASQTLDVWDAGCGQAQISLWLAEQGHQITCSDISARMLDIARESFQQAQLPARFLHQSLQQLSINEGPFDLVLCHAVLEWLAAPYEGLEQIAERVKHGGYLSLLFYNRNAMVYQNVLRGGWRLQPILDDEYIGKGHKLSPPNPLYPHEVMEFIGQLGFEVQAHSGVRVFHDYLNQDALKNSDPEQIFAVEARFCRMPVYRDMGRYIHLLLKRS
ncbi:MAG: methyltransferase domain-containing protein [Methylophaga sp.]|nr:methyltransferase domain-containing protein [Methylophaga sp.]